MIQRVDYRFLVELLREHSGLALDEGKQYLVESRLTPVAASLGFDDLGALVAELRRNGTPGLVRSVCEAMATHESLFFRDGVPFELLRGRLLPELIHARRAARRLRIWSAGASTGQEAYSIAITVLEQPALADWSVEIIGTDYSEAALARARAGRYTHFEAQRGLTIHQLAKYFTRHGTDWQICDRLRRMVDFRQGNLLHPFAALGAFDLVFCRNVLIYFDVPTKCNVLERLADALEPDGYLLLGSAETAVGLTPRLVRVPDTSTTIYRDAQRAAHRAADVRAAS